MAKKVHIEKEACIGCGLCTAMVPEVFDWDDDGKAKIIVDTVPENAVEAVEGAVGDCPTQAIVVG
ncbi:MAG: ferredoxin [Bacilli bacterium]|jgi:ferredoxin